MRKVAESTVIVLLAHPWIPLAILGGFIAAMVGLARIADEALYEVTDD